MASFDIYDFVFYDILKFDPSSSVLTGELQNDVIFGLLVPAVFIFIVLYFFVYHQFGAGSKFLGTLASLTGFGVIITLGWVPLIAGLGGFAFVLILFLAILRGFYSRLIPKGVDTKVYKAGHWLGKTAANKIDYDGIALTEKEMREKYAHLRGCFDRYDRAWKSYDSINKGLANMTTQSTINTGSGASTNNAEAASLRSQSADVQKNMEDISEQAIEIIKSVPRHERKTMIDDVRKHYSATHLQELVHILTPWEK